MIAFLLKWTLITYIILAVLLHILKLKNKNNKFKIGFFHPFCNDGGGGQKVLWCIIQSIILSRQHSKNIQIAIYSLQQDKKSILQKTKNRFSIDLTKYIDNIKIIYIPGRNLLIPQRKLTMVFHLILPIIYALKCLIKYQPDMFYDTTGFSSTLFLTKILLPKTITTSYVHYPFISKENQISITIKSNEFISNYLSSISKSVIKTKLKLFYYHTIYLLYKINGYFIDFAQTNSSWTHNHMINIWQNLQKSNKIQKIYPPCSVQDLLNYKKNTQSQEIIIMSLAQFRPQKNHKSQINTINKIINYIKSKNLSLKIKLYICGTTRGKDDQNILQQLENLTKQLKLQNYVQFKVNKPFSEIQKYFEKALIGIHTMQAEHFGISVVQMLAAGLIVVAHNSAGPKYDIIQNQDFLANSEQDYFNKITKILTKNSQQKQNIIKNNRQKSIKFGQKAFQQQFIKCLQTKINLKNKQN